MRITIATVLLGVVGNAVKLSAKTENIIAVNTDDIGVSDIDIGFDLKDLGVTEPWKVPTQPTSVQADNEVQWDGTICWNGTLWKVGPNGLTEPLGVCI